MPAPARFPARLLARLLPRRLSRLVASFGLGGYLLGTLVALLARDPVLFQRFGSIGVAAAILFFTDHLFQIERRRQQAVERILHEYGLELEVMKEGIDPTRIPSRGYLTDYLKEESRFTALRQHAERINSLNIFLLTAATLQWGFGEPFLRWVL